MKLHIRLLCMGSVLAALVFSMNAHASSYITLEGTSIAFNENSDNQHNPWGMRVRLGVPMAPLMDLEGHLGFSTDGSEQSEDGISTSFGGIYLKGYLPLGFHSALYALGGFGSHSITQTIDGKDFSDRRVGVSYGVGLETRLSERADLTADYVRYVRNEGAFDDVSAFSFGVKFYF